MNNTSINLVRLSAEKVGKFIWSRGRQVELQDIFFGAFWNGKGILRWALLGYFGVPSKMLGYIFDENEDNTRLLLMLNNFR